MVVFPDPPLSSAIKQKNYKIIGYALIGSYIHIKFARLACITFLAV